VLQKRFISLKSSSQTARTGSEMFLSLWVSQGTKLLQQLIDLLAVCFKIPVYTTCGENEYFVIPSPV